MTHVLIYRAFLYYLFHVTTYRTFDGNFSLPLIINMDIGGAGDRNGVGVETETGVSFLAELEGGSLSGM